MKITLNFFSFILFLMLAIGKNVFAAPDPLDHFSILFGPGFELSSQNFNTQNRTHGIGGEFGVGYSLDNNWSLWLTEDSYFYPEFNSNNYFVLRPTAQTFETAISIKYSFLFDRFKPYLISGLGAWLDRTDSGINTFTDQLTPANFSFFWYLRQGVGIQYQLDNAMSLFLESKINIVFVSVPPASFYPTNGKPVDITAINYPFTVGLIFNL